MATWGYRTTEKEKCGFRGIGRGRLKIFILYLSLLQHLLYKRCAAFPALAKSIENNLPQMQFDRNMTASSIGTNIE